MGVPGKFQRGWIKFKDTLKKVGGAVGKFAKNIWNGARNTVNWVRENAPNVMNTATAIAQAGTGITSALGQAGGKFGEAMNRAGQGIQNGVNNFNRNVGIARDVANAIPTSNQELYGT